MSKPEPVILTNMCMICDGDRILVQDRRNPNWPGITFPGGHVEPGESFVRSVIREMKEETGLDIAAPQLCGIKQFTHRCREYRYIVLFYKTDTFSGTLRASDEGEIFWIDRRNLPRYPLADGFDQMLEVFLRDDLSENYHWFDGEWKCENL
ncbi:MAG: 8-oxo-dGTP diphosphatase [Clostridia bacterium]|nr:8-oxo-dGTP diphosphatase [Clostridia bacterium]